jgi:hypothetical protein
MMMGALDAMAGSLHVALSHYRTWIEVSDK